MSLKTHIAQAACLGPIAYYMSDLKTALIFAASFVLIDIDHYLHFIYRTGKFGVVEMFSFYDDIWDRRATGILGLSFFHTGEILLLLVAAGFWTGKFWAVASGFAAHMIFDFSSLWYHRVPFVRALSVTEFIVRRRNYTSDKVF